MSEHDDKNPDPPFTLRRLEPMEIIANQLISINTHLASIAKNIDYLTVEVQKEKKGVE